MKDKSANVTGMNRTHLKDQIRLEVCLINKGINNFILTYFLN